MSETAPPLPSLLVALRGGPAGLPATALVAAAGVPGQLAVEHHGRRELFEFTGRYVTVDGGRSAPLYRWSGSDRGARPGR
ncbi:DUF5988 family protein [Streptomyces sp. NPDC012888]|uniref:DUF5988 family protein n=1 Tax=Streptomyces sp. NPDC012888 TaxID=3364855 RepID=UPI0036A3826D